MAAYLPHTVCVDASINVIGSLLVPASPIVRNRHLNRTVLESFVRCKPVAGPWEFQMGAGPSSLVLQLSRAWCSGVFGVLWVECRSFGCVRSFCSALRSFLNLLLNESGAASISEFHRLAK